MKHCKGIWIALVLAISCFLGAFAVGCNKTETPTPEEQPPAPTVTVAPAALTLDVHESRQLTATKEHTDAAVAWSTSDAGVATVDASGNVTAVGAGQARITAKAGDAQGYCAVTVTNSGAAPVLNIGQDVLAVAKGETQTIDATVTYKGQSVSADVSFAYVGDETEGKAIATFAKNGNSASVVGVEYGQTAIRVSALVYNIPIVKTVFVKVCNTAVQFAVADSEYLTLDKNGYTVAPLDAVAYTTDEATEATFNSVTPAVTVSGNAQGTQIVWSSADTSIAAVDQTGKISGVGVGSTVVTAACDDNFLSFRVSVVKTQVELLTGPTVELTDAMSPEKKAAFNELRNRDLGEQKTDGEGITINNKKWSENFTAFQADIDAFQTDLTVNSTVTLHVTDLLGAKATDEIVQSVVVPWFEVNEDSVNSNGKVYFTRSTAVLTKDLLVADGYNAETKTVTLLPPHTAINMGDIIATVATDKATYTVPLSIYTMIIKSANDLDCFPALTKYQWADNNFLWDGYFVLGNSFTYSTKFWVDEHYNSPVKDNWWKNSCDRVFKGFIQAKLENSVPQWLIGKDGTQSTLKGGARPSSDSKEMMLSGFRGVFDGRGYNIHQFALAAAQSGCETSLIGKLYGAISGSMEVLTHDCGTIRNLSLTDCAAQNSSILCFASAGIVRNVYAHSRWMTQSALLNRRDWTGSKQVVENVVFHSSQKQASDTWYKDECTVNYIGYYQKSQYGGDGAGYIQNVYKIQPAWNTNPVLKFGDSINPGNKVSAFNDTTPETAFADPAALKTYMDSIGLAVDDENGWDSEYWTTDADGAPIMKSAKVILYSSAD